MHSVHLPTVITEVVLTVELFKDSVDWPDSPHLPLPAIQVGMASCAGQVEFVDRRAWNAVACITDNGVSGSTQAGWGRAHPAAVIPRT